MLNFGWQPSPHLTEKKTGNVNCFTCYQVGSVLRLGLAYNASKILVVYES